MQKDKTKFPTKKSLQESVGKHLGSPERFESKLSPTELTTYNQLKTDEEKLRYRLKHMESRMGDQKI